MGHFLYEGPASADDGLYDHDQCGICTSDRGSHDFYETRCDTGISAESAVLHYHHSDHYGNAEQDHVFR